MYTIEIIYSFEGFMHVYHKVVGSLDTAFDEIEYFLKSGLIDSLIHLNIFHSV